jgi:peptidoglycan/LPS O-acetylase OafA/YrhL
MTGSTGNEIVPPVEDRKRILTCTPAASPMIRELTGRPRKTPEHIPALDGLRGIAILMVILCHFLAYGLSSTPRILNLAGTVGGTGVDLFFVLSGFLITRILLAARGQPNFLKNFYARRMLRIFPLYYGFLTLLYVVIPLLHLGQPVPFAKQIWSWTYTQNIGATFFPISSTSIWEWTPHFWSLAVEEHFYLVWPFIVKFANPRRLPFILLATIPFAIFSRCLVLWSGHGVATLTPCRVDALGLGSLLALVSQDAEVFRWISRWAPRLLAIMLPAAAGGLYLFSGLGLPVVQLFKDTFVAVIYSLLLFYILKGRNGGIPQSLLTRPLLTVFGKYSYGMYVFHMTILGLLIPHVHTVWPPLRFAVIVAAVLLVAALSWHFFEQPFLKMKRHFTNKAVAAAI